MSIGQISSDELYSAIKANDNRNLFAGLDMADRAIRAGIRGGLIDAGCMAINLAVMNDPTVPRDEGTLRGSGSVHVNGVFKKSSKDLGLSDKGDPNTDAISGENNPGVMVCTIGFNQPQAAMLHEGMRADVTHVVRNWTEPGSGAKYLEAKMNSFGNELMEAVANRVRAVLA